MQSHIATIAVGRAAIVCYGPDQLVVGWLGQLEKSRVCRYGCHLYCLNYVGCRCSRHKSTHCQLIEYRILYKASLLHW